MAECGACPTHPEAQGIVTDLADDLDQYGQEYGRLADEVCMEDYQEESAEAQQGA